MSDELSSGVQGGSHAEHLADDDSRRAADNVAGSAVAYSPLQTAPSERQMRKGLICLQLVVDKTMCDDLTKLFDAAMAEAASKTAEILKERDMWRDEYQAEVEFTDSNNREKLKAELQSAQQTILDLQGAMSAQDERERLSGERCKVLKEHSGCDWPDAVAEKVLEREQTILDLTKQLDEVKFQRADAEVLAHGAFDLDGNQTMPSRADIESQLRDRDLTIQRLQGAFTSAATKINNYCLRHQKVIDASWIAKVLDEVTTALASDIQQAQAGDKKEGQ